ncbi:hypothetical protein HK099_003986 [Clydaea vesicula]|uniref:Tyrosine specific protein phosphatases domain-containing protein n=1 Tax=Clydaea vesicula TaxID=447962 RepID=A0AAD5XVY3_9FUNG|nr:hypothetical protein HK099_003986 [Clydaea vesicula]
MLKINKGTLAIFLDDFNNLNIPTDLVAEIHQNYQQKRDNSVRHLTVLTPSESTKYNIQEVEKYLQLNAPKFYYLGLGKLKKNATSFIVVGCPQIQLARHQVGLHFKDLHITVGFDFKDTHDENAEKGASSLYDTKIELSFGSPQEILDCLKEHWKLLYFQKENLKKCMLQFSIDLSTFGLNLIEKKPNSEENVAVQVKILNIRSLAFFHARNFEKSMSDAMESNLIAKGNFNESILRLADSSFKLKLYEISAICYWKLFLSYNISSDENSQKLGSHCLKILNKLWSLNKVILETLMFSKENFDFLTASKLFLNEEEHKQYLDYRMDIMSPSEDIEEILDATSDRVMMRNYLKASSYLLPRRFSWIVPLLLAGMSIPRSKEDIVALKEMGVSAVISLTEEKPLDESWFIETDVKLYFWPLTDYFPPSIAHVDKFMEIVLQHFTEKKGSILVHCMGGIGRTGSFLACYLFRFGLKSPPELCDRCKLNPAIFCDDSFCALGYHPVMSATDAISLLRSIRPRSVQTEQQERFIALYSCEIYKRIHLKRRIFNVVVEEMNEKTNGVINFVGEKTANWQLMILCGLPGSGKSYFSKLLAKKKKNCIRISQDEAGNKSICENLVSNYSKTLGKNQLIIDKCNPTPQDRLHWFNLANCSIKDCIVIYFSASPEICLKRCEQRLSHETVKPNSAKNVVESFHKQFVVPDIKKEKFNALYTVSSFADANLLLKEFGVNVDTQENDFVFIKYPRTRHLYDLGSATRDDLVLAETDSEAFLNMANKQFSLTIEEKIDGANLGFRLNEKGEIVCQNRSHYVNTASHYQFQNLNSWIFQNKEALLKILSQKIILFGEWMFAKHSIFYDNLPDVFIAFDAYSIIDKKFFSRRRFLKLLEGSGINSVPIVDHPQILDKDNILKLIYLPSNFSQSAQREGLVLRRDDKDWLHDKAKIVRPGFISGSEHWTKGIIQKNIFNYS